MKITMTTIITRILIITMILITIMIMTTMIVFELTSRLDMSIYKTGK